MLVKMSFKFQKIRLFKNEKFQINFCKYFTECRIILEHTEDDNKVLLENMTER